MVSACTIDLRRFHGGRAPVMLLGGLNLVRALGLARIPAIVASPEGDNPALASRFATARYELPPLDNRHAVVEALVRAGERLAAEFGGAVPLLYGDDDWLALVQDFRDALAPCYRFALNDPDVAAALIDKERFAALGRSRDLPLPRALQWSELEGFPGPVLVKPKSKIAWHDSPIHRRLFGGAGKARVFQSGRELSAHPLALQLQRDLMLQEYVPGGDRELWSFHGFADEKGAALAWFIGRKLRTYPALTGMSSYLELAHDGALAALGRQIAARIPLKGVFKMDFKRDAAGGRWVLLEINARFNLWHHVAARNGVNLPQVAYDYLQHGIRRSCPAMPARHRSTWRWLCLRLDYRAFRELASRGELTWAGWLWSIARPPKVYDLFSWSDPLPFLHHWLARLKRIPRLTLRLWRWLSTAS